MGIFVCQIPHAFEAGNEGIVARFLDVPLFSFHIVTSVCSIVFCHGLPVLRNSPHFFNRAWRHHGDFLDRAGLTELEQYEDGRR